MQNLKNRKVRKLPAWIITATLLLPFTCLANTDMDGNWLITACTTTINYLNGGPESLLNYDNGMCTGYIEGVMDNSFITLEAVMKPTEAHCYIGLFGNVSHGQVIRVVYQYLQNNPKLLNEPANILVTQAFYSAFPIPKSCEKLK